eukprot:709817-Prymnesium_polylepis.1
MLAEASTGAPVAAHVTGNGELASRPPHDHGDFLPSSGAAAVPTTTLPCSTTAHIVIRPRKDSNRGLCGLEPAR